jgi:anti-sigma factor RsiW
MTCTDAKLSLGVYVMNALDLSERAEVDAHLSTCAECRTELADLSSLPAVLDRMTLDDLAPATVTLPDDLFDRVAAKARSQHSAANAPQRARGRRLLAVAAALVVLVGGGVGVWAATRGPHHYISHSAVRMDVTLASQATGTSYTVSVSGLPTDEHCTLIAIAKDGSRDVAGEWDATYQGQAKETGSTDIPIDDLKQLVLLGTDGKRLSIVNV